MKTIKIFPDTASLGQFASVLFAESVMKSIIRQGRFITALSGGSTPRALFQILAHAPYSIDLPWQKMYFFWGDERCVAPNDPESCYHQAELSLLMNVPAPEKNIQRVLGELGSKKAAEEYANRLKEFTENGMDWFRFDLVLLGLGADGHTASLFPGSVETKGIAVIGVSANYQDRPAERVSLTPDVFNSAREVIFLVSGQEKSSALASTVGGKLDRLNFPAQRIQPKDGSVYWLVDESAASQLPQVIEGYTIER